jgi:hypothetical protein
MPEFLPTAGAKIINGVGRFSFSCGSHAFGRGLVGSGTHIGTQRKMNHHLCAIWSALAPAAFFLFGAWIGKKSRLQK